MKKELIQEIERNHRLMSISINEKMIQGKEFIKYDPNKKINVVTDNSGKYLRNATPEEYEQYRSDDKTFTTSSPLNYSKTNSKVLGSTPTQNIDNRVKQFQNKLMKTEFGSLLGPKGADGVWGEKTTNALLSALQKYNSTEQKTPVEGQKVEQPSGTETKQVEKTGIGTQKDIPAGDYETL